MFSKALKWWKVYYTLTGRLVIFVTLISGHSVIAEYTVQLPPFRLLKKIKEIEIIEDGIYNVIFKN